MRNNAHPVSDGGAEEPGCSLQQIQVIRQIQASLQPRVSHSAAVSGALAQLQRCAGAEAAAASAVPAATACAASVAPATAACAVSAACATTSALGGCLSSEGEDDIVCGASPPRRPSFTGASLAADAEGGDAQAADTEAVTLQRRALTSVIRWHPLPRAAAPADDAGADVDAPRGACTHKGEYILVGAAAVVASAAAGQAAAAEQVPASLRLRSVADLHSALEAAEVDAPR
jgi:hypothetical protein